MRRSRSIRPFSAASAYSRALSIASAACVANASREERVACDRMVSVSAIEPLVCTLALSQPSNGAKSPLPIDSMRLGTDLRAAAKSWAAARGPSV